MSADTNSMEKRIKAIDAIVEPLIEERDKLAQAILESKSQFKAGDVIEWDGNRGRVVAIGQWMQDDPMWIVRRFRKNGSVGSRWKVYPWHNPTKVSEPHHRA